MTHESAFTHELGFFGVCEFVFFVVFFSSLIGSLSMLEVINESIIKPPS